MIEFWKLLNNFTSQGVISKTANHLIQPQPPQIIRNHQNISIRIICNHRKPPATSNNLTKASSNWSETVHIFLRTPKLLYNHKTRAGEDVLNSFKTIITQENLNPTKTLKIQHIILILGRFCLPHHYYHHSFILVKILIPYNYIQNKIARAQFPTTIETKKRK